ncbi:MAG: hypothetical protein FP816_18260 [Desulfobacteraceae bacterium]|nr:hypothetical protein [Desulfobacteraceae bacterium]MBU4000895.1 hypothetical protein [Pseudomonadota bacterium]MBU4053924.1 hypothetical protein [Pseudomonadota bacterium]
MEKNNNKIQVIWGVALVLMGVALLFEIPHKIMEYQQLSNPFLQFCLYFIAIALIVGGVKKVLKFKKMGDI